jgi:hypothetical protein
MIEKGLRLPSLPSQSAPWISRFFTETFFYLLFSTVVKFQFWDYRFSEFTKQLYCFIFSIPTSKWRKSLDFLHFFHKGFI